MNKVDVTLEADQTFELKDDEPRYGAYSCDTETHTSYFDVTLNRDELIDHNSKFIGLKSKEFGMYSSDKIDVSIPLGIGTHHLLVLSCKHRDIARSRCKIGAGCRPPD